jgi:hypothetical protein
MKKILVTVRKENRTIQMVELETGRIILGKANLPCFNLGNDSFFSISEEQAKQYMKLNKNQVLFTYNGMYKLAKVFSLKKLEFTFTCGKVRNTDVLFSFSTGTILQIISINEVY